MKKLITFLSAVLFLTACSQEQLTTENELQVNDEQDQKINALDDYIAQMESHFEVMNEQVDFIKGKTASDFIRSNELYTKRVLFRNSQKAQSDLRKNSKTVIQVPGDYSTLQEAVDNSQTNGLIKIVGNLDNQGEVELDVPGLKIMGQEGSSISGTTIFFLAENIELSNLNLQIRIVIGTEGDGARVLNNNLKTDPYFANFGLISLNNTSGCIIEKNEISDPYDQMFIGILGIECSDNEFKSNTVFGSLTTLHHMWFVDSNNIEVKDCVMENGGIPGAEALLFLSLSEKSDNNTIKGCTVRNINGDGIGFIGGPCCNPNDWGENNHIIDCTVINHSGIGFSRGIGMQGVASSSIRNCMVNNKDAVNPDNVHSEGIGMGFVVDSKIENCTAEYNSGGGIVLAGDLFGENSIRNCKANNNGGTLNPNGLGTFGFWISPNKFQQTYGSVTIDNCEANNNKSIATPQRMISALEVWSPAVKNFSFTISNCKANDNTGALGGITALLFIIDFPGSPYVRNPDILWNINNNQANGNNQRGISLFGTDNALVANNTAQYNGLCDFGETLNVGTVLKNNDFGTLCDDPIPVP